ncbi:hypothetical protein QBC33DRAFT_557705 [Phialemonium atrogriseum]|uniref:Protein kinase domain-containing protein n=1 Tax=Phialemonium atrogriseum TaxID=1093897 RepID=A0AAJ0FQ99_9PEZI|nr:uncharacterized protein QBC33DRAFT_557705 [Phialemonium atrogriseum]KAK1768945.1 hypothetical protein QBC33DRAFT_557705 [Phialemonium atrogriseum]
MPSNPAAQPPDASVGSSTESRTNSRLTTGQQYCTQECLRGLLDGGALDKSCPNAHKHGHDRHQISASVFCTLMQRQLAEDLDANFALIGLPGSRGVPFRVRLASHGYTLAAKCTPPDFVAHLTHEAAVYGRLRPIQGIHVPVHLGNINLVQPYYYEGIAELTHVMFLSFGGNPIHEHINAANRTQLIEQVESCFHAIHMLDVLHRDAKSRNIIRHEGSGRVMVIDFERAELRTPRPMLGVISPNRKRRELHAGYIKPMLADQLLPPVYRARDPSGAGVAQARS